MRIALIINALGHGGAERVISRLSVIFSDAGHEVFLILFADNKLDYDYTGEIISLNSNIGKGLVGKILSNIKRIKDLRKIKMIYRFDAAISFLDTPNITNIMTKYKEKVIVSVRNFKSIEDKGVYRIINKEMIKILYPKANKVVVVSNALLEDMRNNYKLPKYKLKTIYNPYDIKQICDMGNEVLPYNYQEFYDIHRVIISMGRLTHQKGYWNLIKAFAYLKKKLHNAGLVIIGDGDQEIKLKKLVNSLSLDNDILFVGYQKNPFMFINKSEVYALTSLFEGFPNALVESMACGVPIVSVDCKSGPREILYEEADLDCCAHGIEYADYGILCPAFDDEDTWSPDVFSVNQKNFANAINILLDDSKIWENYSKKAIERAKDFSYEKCKNNYLKLLD